MVPADLMVMAAGIKPNTVLAKTMGLHCAQDGRDGISVSDTLQTAPTPASTRWASARRTAASPAA